MMTLKRLVSAAAALLLLLHQADDVTSFSLPAASLTSSRTHHHHHPTIANPTKSTSSSLQAINLPSWTYYSLAHVIGGTTGTPIVISGTKKGSWFDRIPKPSINPPNFVFGPVWTLLYSLMGVSVSRIVKSTSSTSSSMVLKLWYIHYALNLIWAPIFFGYQKFRLGFIISILLVVSLGLIMPLYHTIDPISAYLQVPYLCWLIFATVLNYQFCKLNPMDESDGKNEAMRQAELCKDGKAVYNDVMLQNDLRGLQKDAARYAGL
jgi:tryptophan-rich sensory protein